MKLQQNVYAILGENIYAIPNKSFMKFQLIFKWNFLPVFYKIPISFLSNFT